MTTACAEKRKASFLSNVTAFVHRDCKRFHDDEPVDRLFTNLIEGWAFEADDLLLEKERTFHQGPRVTTLKLEAGYMHAVLSQAKLNSLVMQAGSIYALDSLPQS
jgi:hypothetical protein